MRKFNITAKYIALQGKKFILLATIVLTDFKIRLINNLMNNILKNLFMQLYIDVIIQLLAI